LYPSKNPHIVGLMEFKAPLETTSMWPHYDLCACQLAITAAATSESMSKDGLRIEEMGGASTHSPKRCVFTISLLT